MISHFLDFFHESNRPWVPSNEYSMGLRFARWELIFPPFSSMHAEFHEIEMTAFLSWSHKSYLRVFGYMKCSANPYR
jgi:hypothetical protein